MTTYTPDRWVVLEFVTPQETLHKVFAGWYGGYLGSDSWKLNSGIIAVRKQDDCWEFDGYSGSIYRCNPKYYGISGYMHSILSRWLTQAEQRGDVTIEIIDIDELVET